MITWWKDAEMTLRQDSLTWAHWHGKIGQLKSGHSGIDGNNSWWNLMIMVTLRFVLVHPLPWKQLQLEAENCRLGVYEFACSFHVKLHNKRKSTCKRLRQITFFRLSWVPEDSTGISKCQMHKETRGARWWNKTRGSRSRIKKGSNWMSMLAEWRMFL